MSGRGLWLDNRYFKPSANPLVSIGLTLSTSPTSLSLKTITDPFYVVIDARIIKTPYPEKPITLCISRTPLEHFRKNFDDMVCTSNAGKKIEIMSHFSDCYRYDFEDLGDHDFVTIPPQGQGTITIKHQVSQEAIDAAQLSAGERYSFQMNNRFLGTFWWDFGTLDDVAGRRIRRWGARPEFMRCDFAKEDVEDILEDMREHIERYGTRLVAEGQDRKLLALVDESGPVEFEVV